MRIDLRNQNMIDEQNTMECWECGAQQTISEIHTADMQFDLRNQNVIDGQSTCKDICEWNAEVSQLLMDSHMSIHERNPKIRYSVMNEMQISQSVSQSVNVKCIFDGKMAGRQDGRTAGWQDGKTAGWQDMAVRQTSECMHALIEWSPT